MNDNDKKMQLISSEEAANLSDYLSKVEDLLAVDEFAPGEFMDRSLPDRAATPVEKAAPKRAAARKKSASKKKTTTKKTAKKKRAAKKVAQPDEE